MTKFKGRPRRSIEGCGPGTIGWGDCYDGLSRVPDTSMRDFIMPSVVYSGWDDHDIGYLGNVVPVFKLIFTKKGYDGKVVCIKFSYNV
jgi:hypothetical protein